MDGLNDTCRAAYERYKDGTVISQSLKYAHWTLPYIMPSMDIRGQRNSLMNDYQETGSILVNHLANKLAGLLFPAQYPFFKSEISGSLQEIAEAAGLSQADIRKTLANLEMEANKALFINGGYADIILALKSLIVTGNVLIHRDSAAKTLTTYTLDKYTTQRDSRGALLDCVLREQTTFGALPPLMQNLYLQAKPGAQNSPEQPLDKFTRIKRVQNSEGVLGYSVYYELDTVRVGEPSWYPVKTCPFIAPTWTLIPGEHYGRGMVGDYAQGFAKLSTLSEQLLLYTVEAMRCIHLVMPGAQSSIDDLAKAETGAYVPGDPTQMGVHESGDASKIQMVSVLIDQTKQALQQAFMYIAEARDSDRTTATEIQMGAREADYALGGVYSTLAAGIQLPLAHILLAEVSTEAEIGVLTGELTPDITVGVAALGRSADVQNLLQASQELAGVAPIVQVDNRLDIKRIVDVILAGRSIDPEAIMHTPEEMQAMAEAAAAEQQAQMEMLQAQQLTDTAETIGKII